MFAPNDVKQKIPINKPRSPILVSLRNDKQVSANLASGYTVRSIVDFGFFIFISKLGFVKKVVRFEGGH